ncbi:MAG: sigma-70 family RNA polymerase sigma factor [Gammaproteobacteria bacterium]|nr:sigma-70 family RNA polymerase sigma factor [Gammaproteobacteria bacterium]
MDTNIEEIEAPTYERPVQNSTKSGKYESLSNLYSRFWEDICKYVNSTFGSGPPDPEDIAQAVFTNYAALDNTAEIENPRAFLYRSAHNMVVSHHRKAATRRRYMVEQKNNNPIRERDDIHPERILITRERLALLERVMWEMPAKRRRMLVLNRFDGLTYAEISRQSGLSQSAVKKHVMKALADFNKALKRTGLKTEKSELNR